MSQQTAIWGHIRAGQGPTPRRVDDVIARSALLLGREGVEQATASLGSAVLGAGPLDPLLADEVVTDVLVNGTLGVFVDRGEGLTRCDVQVGDEEAVRRLAVRLAGLARRRLDEASPYVDGLLPGGVRLHAVLPPLVDGGAHISLRVPRRRVSSLEQLQAHGSFPKDWMPVLEAIITGKHAYVVTGGTGTGKTTLLAALLAKVPAAERLLVVEDVRELHVQHPHAVRMQTRPPNVEGTGHVDMVALVRQSLRMRPDRLVVGEVRGAEVREMLTALNTGHEGGCGTLHANSSLDVVARFEALGALAGMTPQATRSQLSSAVELVVHLRRGQRRRYVACIGVLGEVEGELAVLPALMQDPPRAAAGELDTEPVPRVCEPGWQHLADLLDGRAR